MSLDAIGIVSKNPALSVQFYKFFGIELAPCGGDDHFEGSTSSGVRIMLDSAELTKKLNPNWKEAAGGGIVLCFKQSSPRQVNELHKQITAAGFKEVKAPWDAFWGQRYSSVLDPDGNQVDLFALL